MAKPEPELFEARFSGAFDLDDSELALVEPDSEVFIVVHARVTGEALDIHPKTGVVKQVSKIKVGEAAVVRTTQLRDSLCDSLGLTRPTPQLPFNTPERIDNLEAEVLDRAEVAVTTRDTNPKKAFEEPDENTSTDVDVVRHGKTGGARDTDPILARFINAS
jgi:hypothetical protein